MVSTVRIDALALMSTRVVFALVDIKLAMLPLISLLARALVAANGVDTSPFIATRVVFALVDIKLAMLSFVSSVAGAPMFSIGVDAFALGSTASVVDLTWMLWRRGGRCWAVSADTYDAGYSTINFEWSAGLACEVALVLYLEVQEDALIHGDLEGACCAVDVGVFGDAVVVRDDIPQSDDGEIVCCSADGLCPEHGWLRVYRIFLAPDVKRAGTVADG